MHIWVSTLHENLQQQQQDINLIYDTIKRKFSRLNWFPKHNTLKTNETKWKRKLIKTKNNENFDMRDRKFKTGLYYTLNPKTKARKNPLTEASTNWTHKTIFTWHSTGTKPTLTNKLNANI